MVQGLGGGRRVQGPGRVQWPRRSRGRHREGTKGRSMVGYSGPGRGQESRQRPVRSLSTGQRLWMKGGWVQDPGW